MPLHAKVSKWRSDHVDATKTARASAEVWQMCTDKGPSKWRPDDVDATKTARASAKVWQMCTDKWSGLLRTGSANVDGAGLGDCFDATSRNTSEPPCPKVQARQDGVWRRTEAHVSPYARRCLGDEGHIWRTGSCGSGWSETEDAGDTRCSNVVDGVTQPKQLDFARSRPPRRPPRCLTRATLHTEIGTPGLSAVLGVEQSDDGSRHLCIRSGSSTVAFLDLEGVSVALLTGRQWLKLSCSAPAAIYLHSVLGWGVLFPELAKAPAAPPVLADAHAERRRELATQGKLSSCL